MKNVVWKHATGFDKGLASFWSSNNCDVTLLIPSNWVKTLNAMKTKLFLLLFSLATFRVMADSPSTSTIAAVISSIEKADAKGVVSLWSARAELIIERNRQNLTSAEAEVALREWFQRNPAAAVEKVHEGGGDTAFAILRYTSGSSKYRILFRVHANKIVFMEINRE
jgi:hypothetical protein